MSWDLGSPEMQALLDAVVALRRDIHAHPEPGFEEHETRKRIIAALGEHAGLSEASMRFCAGTGLIVDIVSTGGAAALPSQGDLPIVKTIALRADMDALRMTEGNLDLPHRSQNEGVAHMCGHDGHTAALVGAAACIARRASKLPAGSRVRLLFQPAEEGPGGALPMLKEGALDGIDEVYGMHNWPTVPLGQALVKAGPLMAHVSDFEIVVTGKGVHASQPQKGIDTVLIASTIVTQLHTIVSRTLPSSANAVVSPTMFQAGELTNVIPDTATIKGTIRDLSPDHFATITRRIDELAHGVAAAHGATATVTINDMYPVVVNHEACTAEVVRLARSELAAGCDDGAANGLLPVMGAEDFSYFMMPEHGGKPGCFFFLGGFEKEVGGFATYDLEFNPGAKRMCLPCGKDETSHQKKSEKTEPVFRTNCMCHATGYDFNDNLLPIAVRFWVRLVESRLGCSLYDAEELM